ncbi:MAG: EAL domain-containing protein, partial [Gammaproteobacteria bacterium]|nr:EAL domain-containing protein [Gammaproteobacteria bacterium]
FSMLITAILTVIQLGVDYKIGLNRLHDKFDLIEKSYLSSITNALWEFDNDYLKLQVGGISDIADLQYVEVRNKDQIVVSAGQLRAENVIIKEFPVIHNFRGNEVNLGSLKVIITLESLYENLFDKVLIIAVSQLIKTFLVSFFIFFIFYNLVGIHLARISSYTQNLNSKSLDEVLVLDRNYNKSPYNEIDQLVSSINSMCKKLYGHQQQLSHRASHDQLTQLPNRVLLIDRLKQAIEDAKRDQSKIAVLFVDIDHFKNINDTYGHKFGDQVLLHVAQRFTDVLRKNDTLSRIGGDEFVALTRLGKDGDDASLLAQKMLSCLQHDFIYDDVKIVLNISVGISVYPDDCKKVELLLRNADAAMYKAKALGRNNFQFYSPELTKASELRIEMQSEISDALQHDEFLVYYQPQVDSLTNEVKGAEALVRWQHPTKGFMSPNEFIPIAEHTGQIHLIDQWVLDKVAQFVTQHNNKVPKIAINFSSRSFAQESLSEVTINSLNAALCTADKIEIEITESHLLIEPKKSIGQMQRLSNSGVTIAIDDFGIGYSSLSYLKNLPINKLKIDKSLVDNLENDASDRAIIRAIITLGRSLDLQLIAEGVETQAQCDFLAKSKCTLIQGYYFSQPLSEEDFLDFLAEKQVA